MTDEPRVEATHTFYRNEHGELRERMTVGSQVIYDHESSCVFIDTSSWGPYPWEGKLVVQ
jgi:hypothetical protein